MTPPDRPVSDPGTAEFDALMEAIEQEPERATLMIPVSPPVIRWLLRGTFVREDGVRARMIGGTIQGRELTPVFREEQP